MIRILTFSLLFLTTSTIWAQTNDWSFVWVVPQGGKYYTEQGVGKVTIKNGHLSAKLTGNEGSELILSGKIQNKQVKVKFSQLNTDFFIDAPLSGTHTRSREFKGSDQPNREWISLSDGLSFLGMTREVRR